VLLMRFLDCALLGGGGTCKKWGIAEGSKLGIGNVYFRGHWDPSPFLSRSHFTF
jgi:hypothetical protein